MRTRHAMVVLLIIAAIAAFSSRLDAQAQPQPGQPRPGQEEFVPVDQLPPEEQLPAAPLLVAAYAFVWVALIVYVWSLWRRIARVERELGDVARRVAGKGSTP